MAASSGDTYARNSKLFFPHPIKVLFTRGIFQLRFLLPEKTNTSSTS